jgi:phage-related holin
MKNLLLATLAVLAPLESTVLTVLAIVLMDLLTGLVAARKTHTNITSAGLKRTIVKLAVYLPAILGAYLVGTYLTGPYIPVANIVGGFIGITELKSILENLDAASGGVGLLSLINKKLTSAENSINPDA